MKIAILHPDLGIGGAERLIIDVALALKSKGHEIRIFSNHHDRAHCFNETKDGSLETEVIGDRLPRSLCGHFIAICAYIRMIYAAYYLVFKSDYHPDLYICDQVSACIPVLKRSKKRVIFYCHFPDLLLTERKNWLKRLYRFPLDWLEEKTTGMADDVLVNSNFTAGVFKETFRSLQDTRLNVIHPTINTRSLLRPLPNVTLDDIRTDASIIFLSINRYERKKNVMLAIEAMNKLKRKVSAKEFNNTHLIIAGGYDERVSENKEYYWELTEFAELLDLRNVSFLKSPNDDKKRVLFHCCTAVLYTPSNEHFGIVPLEAMLSGRPVIACNSGGPLETILDEQTGFLCDPTADAFAEKMAMIAKDRSLARELGVVASEHVKRNFSFQVFEAKLNSVIEQ